MFVRCTKAPVMVSSLVSSSDSSVALIHGSSTVKISVACPSVASACPSEAHPASTKPAIALLAISERVFFMKFSYKTLAFRRLIGSGIGATATQHKQYHCYDDHNTYTTSNPEPYRQGR